MTPGAMTQSEWERVVDELHRPIRELVARADSGGYLPAGEPCTQCGTPLERPEELHIHLYSGVCRACVTAPPVLELVWRDGAMAANLPDASLDRRAFDPPTRRTTITYPDCRVCHGLGDPQRLGWRCESCWQRWSNGRWQHWYVTRRDQLEDIAYRRFLRELDQAAGVPDGATDAQRHRLIEAFGAERATAVRDRVIAVHVRVRWILDRWAFDRGVYGAKVARPLDGGRRPPRLVTRRVRCNACQQPSLLSSGASDDLATLPCPICRTPALTGGQVVQAAAGLDADERRRLPLRIARFDGELAAHIRERTAQALGQALGEAAAGTARTAGGPQYPWRLDDDLDADLLAVGALGAGLALRSGTAPQPPHVTVAGQVNR